MPSDFQTISPGYIHSQREAGVFGLMTTKINTNGSKITLITNEYTVMPKMLLTILHPQSE